MSRSRVAGGNTKARITGGAAELRIQVGAHIELATIQQHKFINTPARAFEFDYKNPNHAILVS